MKILYSDKNIIVCIKPFGALSTDEPGGMPDLIRNELKLPDAEIHAVHRLDRVAGGLMVYARTQKAAAELGKQISERRFDKKYMAVVHGCPDVGKGRMDDLLFRDSSSNTSYVVTRKRKGVRDASLEYEVLAQKDELSLMKITLLTGRTHQIRVQFSSRKMPLFGDRKYGAPETGCGVALWSCELNFTHPQTGDKLHFSALPPQSEPWALFEGLCVQQQDENAELPGHAAARKNAAFPACPHAKKCGGCRFQGMNYARQLEIKQKKLEQLLGEFGPLEQIEGADNPFHYRNKVAAAFGLDEKKRIVSGIYQPESHKIVSVDSCLIEDEKADEIILAIRGMLRGYKIQVFDERKGTGWLRHVLVRRSPSTGEVMVVLVAVSPIFALQKPFLKELLEKYPEIRTVLLNVNDGFTPVVLGRQEKVLYGPGFIEDELLGYRFRISSKSFYQVNPAQTAKLYSTAIDFAGLLGKETVLDAYCGTGTIGICASARAASVAGVEINRDAVKDAIANAKKNEVRNCRFVCADASEYMEDMAAERESCDVVFMDPPRAGSDERFLNSLLKMRPAKIIYISCCPETLARDLRVLVKGKYKVGRIKGVDMFPFTEHVETVVLMSRKDK